MKRLLHLALVLCLYSQLAWSYCDDMNGSDTPLATHNSNWIDAGSNFTVAKWAIVSNQAQGTNIFVSGGALYNLSSDDTSQVLFKATTDVTNKKAPCVRGANTGTNGTGYCADFNTISGGNYTSVRVLKNGAFVGDFGSLSYSDASDWTLKITASGTSTVTIHVFVDGTDLGTQTDSSSPLGAGKPGFMYTANGAALSTTNLDDWQDSAGCGAAAAPPLRALMGVGQ